MFDPEFSAELGAPVDRMRAASRLEARAAAERLSAIWDLYIGKVRDHGQADDWAADTQDAVAAEVAAGLNISLWRASSYVRYARAMGERIPRVGAVFAAGDIDWRLFQTIAYRSELVTDPQALAAVDAQLARRAPRWTAMTERARARMVDRVVAAIDRDAVRRRKQAAEQRGVWIADSYDGLSSVEASLVATDAHTLDERLDGLAGGVCAADPRTRGQRRADALGALAAGLDRLPCGCGQADCPAGGGAPRRDVVIHLVAEQASVNGHADAPAVVLGGDDLIPAELIAELAAQARICPLIDAPSAAPEPNRIPSARLAQFVRARDLTCRAPGCDQPATHCDIDHTVAFADGGLTHASNLKCLCRKHHLIKTFWGWHDKQLPDGTVIWTMPDGQCYVTMPASALLFPTLCKPAQAPPVPERQVVDDRAGDRSAMMPKRTRTRAQNQAYRIAAERRYNHQRREARAQAMVTGYYGPRPPAGENDEPPPF